MNYALKYGLQPADRIVESIFQTGITKHHAIYLGRDERGDEWVAENHKFDGVRPVKARDYFTRGKLIKVRKFVGGHHEREQAVRRALRLLGKPYNLIDFNCEHYAEYVQSGKATSEQVNTVMDALKVAAVVAAVIGFVNIIVNE